MTTDPKLYKELLEAYSYAILYGVIDKSELIVWADKIIAADTVPDDLVIDLALIENKAPFEISSLISNYFSNERSQLAVRAFMGLFGKGLNIRFTPGEIIFTLYKFIDLNDQLTSREEAIIANLETDIDLAMNSSYPALDQVEKQIKDFLSVYKDFNTDNFDQWQRINDSIDQQLETLKF